MNRLIAACLVPLALSGCPGFQAGISAVGMQAPGILGELEQTKTAIAIAPLAGCVSEVQQATMLINALQTGMPAIPVKPTAPPILTVPAQPTPSPMPPPTPAPPPPTMPGNPHPPIVPPQPVTPK